MKFYVYLLFRPWNGVPCYVGKGQGARVHYHSAKGDQHYNKHLGRIIKKAQGALPFVVLMATDDEDQALAWEMKFIKAIGRASSGSGPLCNLTDGGEGVSGYTFSPEQKARNVQINIERYASMSDEWKAEFSEVRSVGLQAYLDQMPQEQKVQRTASAASGIKAKLAAMTPAQKLEHTAPAHAAVRARAARLKAEKTTRGLEDTNGGPGDQRPGAIGNAAAAAADVRHHPTGL